jgi:RNA polymerase sigma-70 factor (ECF subfamily)
VTVAVADLLTLPPSAATLHESRDCAEVLALVAATRTGSQAAFGDLVTMHQRAVLRTAMAALGSREDAEDAAQGGPFVVAWRKLRGFRGDSTFRTWLMTIAWRKALDKRRKQLLWRKRTQSDLQALTTPLDAMAGATPIRARDGRRRSRASRASGDPGAHAEIEDTLLLAASGEHSSRRHCHDARRADRHREVARRRPVASWGAESMNVERLISDLARDITTAEPRADFRARARSARRVDRRSRRLRAIGGTTGLPRRGGAGGLRRAKLARASRDAAGPPDAR